jgi:hypothetical protein
VEAVREGSSTGSGSLAYARPSALERAFFGSKRQTEVRRTLVNTLLFSPVLNGVKGSTHAAWDRDNETCFDLLFEIQLKVIG